MSISSLLSYIMYNIYTKYVYDDDELYERRFAALRYIFKAEASFVSE